MSWTSRWNANFTKPLVRQIVAIIQRDQRAALDWVGGANVLPSIVEFDLALVAIRQFPALLVTPLADDFALESSDTRQQSVRLAVSIAATDQRPGAVVELVEDYVRALDAVLLTVPLTDFAAALSLTLPHLGTINTTPLAAGVVKDLVVEAHAYDEARALRGNIFAMTATLGVRVEMEEI